MANKFSLAVNRQEGFSLIEGMIAAALLTVGLLALSGMQGLTLGRNVDAYELTRAANLASDMMERIEFNRRNVDSYNGVKTWVACGATLPTMTAGDCVQWTNLLASSYASGLNNVRGEVTATATGPVGLNQRSVQVRLTWTGAAGAGKVAKSRAVTLTSVIAPE